MAVIPAYVRTALIFSMILVISETPSGAFACSSTLGIHTVVIPWTPNYASDCSVKGYDINWIAVASLSAISAASVLIIRHSIRNRAKVASV
jgi:hypothetical protein